MTQERIEARRAYGRMWYAKNRERQHAYFKKWRADHAEEEKLRSKLKYERTKDVCAVRNKARYEEKKDEILASGRISYKKNSKKTLQRCWEYKLRAIFGISPEDYYAMLAAQGGACAICRSVKKRRLGVDHCHDTGKVRGLLCHSCNIALGLLKDSIASAEAIVCYLRAAQ